MIQATLEVFLVVILVVEEVVIMNIQIEIEEVGIHSHLATIYI